MKIDWFFVGAGAGRDGEGLYFVWREDVEVCLLWTFLCRKKLES
jgi:hypothetical protein